ncbi:MAG TPA: hypothetical protein ENK79_01410 [Campylobacterales bacterium]|nr:hypothetical protein [Campylobacterales bacterium]
MFWKTLVFSLIIGSLSLLYSMEDFNTTQDTNSSDSSNKITFLYIDSDTCEFCRRLDEMLNAPKPAELLEKYFIVRRELLNEDLELPDGLPLPYGTPTVYFLDNKEQAIMEPMRGEKTEEELLYFLNEAIRENQKTISKKEEKSKTIWQKLFNK